MRVTRVIREFIEEQVIEIFGVYQPLPKRAQFDKGLELINEEIKAFAKARGIELAKSHSLSETEVKLGYTFANLNNTFINITNPYAYKDNILKREHNARIEKEVKDIIVTLELGGTKAELMEILAKLKEKVGQ